MKFNDVQVLGVNYQDVRYDSNLTFKKTKTVTLTGNLLSLENTSGVKTIFNEYTDLLQIENELNNSDGSFCHNLQKIYINDVDYGEGKVLNMSLSGEQIRDAQYVASLEFYEAGVLSDIILTNNNNNPNDLSESNLTAEDLKSLEGFSESFNFSHNSGVTSVAHNFNCSFGSRMPKSKYRKNLWNNASIQNSKLLNLNNKGKGAIKVAAGTTASQTINLTSGTYIVEVEYLGQNATSRGSCSFSCEGVTVNFSDSYTFEKVEFSITSTKDVTLSLIANSDNDTFFDNIKVFDKSKTPIEKSRELSNFIFQSSPEYPIILTQIGQSYNAVELFENFQSEESFDHINNQYSLSKTFNFGDVEISGNKKYSLINSVSIEFRQNGTVTVRDDNLIQCLSSKTDSDLKQFVVNESAKSRDKCKNILSNYGNYFSADCPTNTSTEKIDEESLYEYSDRSSVNYNFDQGEASLTIEYSTDPINQKSNGKYYKADTDTEIEFYPGFQILKFNGRITGYGTNSTDRKNNAKQAIIDFVSNKDALISELKTRYSVSGDFAETGTTISYDNLTGGINYNYTFSNEKGYNDMPESVKTVAKKYEISVENQNRINVFNNFSINCNQVAQVMGDLFSPKIITTKITVYGKEGVGFSNLLTASQAILSHKSLLLGTGSKNSKDYVKNTYTDDQYIVDESFSYDKEREVIDYNRSVLDMSDCTINTPTSTFKFGDFPHSYGEDFGPVPTPTAKPVEEYDDGDYEFDYTPTKFVSGIGDYEDFEPYTPNPGQDVEFPPIQLQQL